MGGGVITRQTLLIYNFGIAMVFVVAAVLSLVFEPILDRPTIQPPFDPASLTAMREEYDVERLRQQAAFYFELGRDLKRARYSDTNTQFRDFRLLCIALAVGFALGGAMTMVVTRGPAVPQKATAPTA